MPTAATARGAGHRPALGSCRPHRAGIAGNRRRTLLRPRRCDVWRRGAGRQASSPTGGANRAISFELAFDEEKQTQGGHMAYALGPADIPHTRRPRARPAPAGRAASFAGQPLSGLDQAIHSREAARAARGARLAGSCGPPAAATCPTICDFFPHFSVRAMGARAGGGGARGRGCGRGRRRRGVGIPATRSYLRCIHQAEVLQATVWDGAACGARHLLAAWLRGDVSPLGSAQPEAVERAVVRSTELVPVVPSPAQMMIVLLAAAAVSCCCWAWLGISKLCARGRDRRPGDPRGRPPAAAALRRRPPTRRSWGGRRGGQPCRVDGRAARIRLSCISTGSVALSRVVLVSSSESVQNGSPRPLPQLQLYAGAPSG